MVTIKRTVCVDAQTGTEVWQHECCGLSSDTKPNGLGVNSLFLELDTGDVYYFTGAAWVKAGG